MKDKIGQVFKVGDLVVKAEKLGGNPLLELRYVERISEDGQVFLSGCRGRPLMRPDYCVIVNDVNVYKHVMASKGIG